VVTEGDDEVVVVDVDDEEEEDVASEWVRFIEEQVMMISENRYLAISPTPRRSTSIAMQRVR